MINVNEILKGSILCHEGKAKKVIAIGDYIQFEGFKVWIGGSMINGEPLSVPWLERLGFGFVGDSRWKSLTTTVLLLQDGTFSIDGVGRFFSYVHQLQLAYFVLTGEYLKVPKLPK